MAGHRVNGPRGRGDPSRRSRYDPREIGLIRSLLAFVPIAVILHLAGASAAIQFVRLGGGDYPLGGSHGRGDRAPGRPARPGIGGLLNATFGNAAELIIALFALSRGLDDVVKASITGSVIGNLLLVLGGSVLAGGLKYPVQKFNKTAAGVGGTMLVLAAVGPARAGPVPQARRLLGIGPRAGAQAQRLGLRAAAGDLRPEPGLHPQDAQGFVQPQRRGRAPGRKPGDGHRAWGVRRSSAVLLGATAVVAWMSEILVSAVEPAGHALGLSGVFMA